VGTFLRNSVVIVVIHLFFHTPKCFSESGDDVSMSPFRHV